jgi:hypothetical protein
VKTLLHLTSWLVLPLALLLFAQWPLRELVQAYSRQANDLGQVLFACYMAVAVTAASRAGVHLAAPHRMPAAGSGAWRRWALLLCIAPWAVFLLLNSSPWVWASTLQLERFSETLNPGFFVIKLAGWLMVVLALIDALVHLRRSA